MARIRNIKPEFWDDETLARVSRDCRLLFIGLWNQADKAGRLEDRPSRLKVRLFPYDADVTSEAISTWLNGLACGGFITRYVVAGHALIQIRTFTKHQYLSKREPESDLPGPEKADTSPIPVLDESQPGTTDIGHRTVDIGQGTCEAGARTPDTRRPASIAVHREHLQHVTCGIACVPQFLHDEFLRSLNRPLHQQQAAADELFAAYRAHLDSWPAGTATGAPLTFWRNWFQRTYGPAAKTAGKRAVTAAFMDATRKAIEAV